jgi:hypothetical protein
MEVALLAFHCSDCPFDPGYSRSLLRRLWTLYTWKTEVKSEVEKSRKTMPISVYRKNSVFDCLEDFKCTMTFSF